jgi:hypothetical protein
MSLTVGNKYSRRDNPLLLRIRVQVKRRECYQKMMPTTLTIWNLLNSSNSLGGSRNIVRIWSTKGSHKKPGTYKISCRCLFCCAELCNLLCNCCPPQNLTPSPKAVNAPVDISYISSSGQKIDKLDLQKLNAAKKKTLAIALVKLLTVTNQNLNMMK